MKKLNLFKKFSIQSFLRNVSLRFKFFTFIFGIGIFSVVVIEYVHYYYKKISVEKLESDLKNFVELAYNDFIYILEKVEKGYFTFTEGMEILKKRFNGPIQKTEIIINKEAVKEDVDFIFEIFAIDRNNKKINLSNEFMEIQSTEKYKFPIRYIDDEKIKITFPTQLSEKIYKKFLNLPDSEKDILLNKYNIRFIRDLSKGSLKIGSDGYIYVLTSYTPEWMLPNTKFPEDYTLEKIEERFKSNFNNYFNTKEELNNYLNRFGDSPEKQYDFIQNELVRIKENPDPAIPIFHPFLEFVNLDNAGQDGVFPGRIIAIQKNGFFRYKWRNVKDLEPRTKIAFLKSIKYHNDEKNIHIHWVIGIGAYEDESYLFVNLLRRNLYFFLISFYLLIFLLYHFFVKSNLIKPINKIIHAMQEVNKGNYNTYIKLLGKDELGYIARTFNKMTYSIRKKNNQLQDYTNKLNHMVEERTAQLQKTLNELKKLKEIQDGDYYLNFLLLKELGSIKVNQNNILVESIVKQKKEFEFRNKKGEIGGDLIIANTIYLQEKPYLFFLNADSMGKSLQGAAGSIIIGSVIESILDRTLNAFIFKNYSPERWLKNTYSELRHIFSSFKNSMGATMIIGLIDSQNGTMYFLNAEHPPLILYRNHKAFFIENPGHLPRLGVKRELQEDSEFFYVKVFKLKNNDMIFIGSDGKDDIKNPNGEIISDENLILEIIKNQEGNLNEIYKNLLQIGEIIDDLSLLKIVYKSENIKELYIEDQKYFIKLKNEFQKNPELIINQLLELHNQFPKDIKILKLILQYFINIKNYKKIIEFGTKYFELDSSNNSLLYLIFYSFTKEKNYKQAIEYGERYYLRNPKNINFLLRLSQCHFILNNFSRAEYLIEKVLSIEPENSKVKELMKKFY